MNDLIRFYSAIRALIPWLPDITVTDDLPSGASSALGVEASAQVFTENGAFHVRLAPGSVPGEALAFHEAGHIIQFVVRARLISTYGGQVGELLWDNEQRKILAMRPLKTTGNETEGFASLVAESFTGQPGGYYAESVPDAMAAIATWYASPGAGVARDAIIGLDTWAPTLAEIDASTPRPTISTAVPAPQPQGATFTPAPSPMLSDWSIQVGRDIARALATLLGIPVPENAWLAFAVQAQRECAGGTSIGAQNNNPLNLTTAGGRITWPGQTGTYGGGDATEWHGDFAAFGSLEAGSWACASNYASDSYVGVQAAFRDGDPVAIAEAIEASPWDSAHYTDPDGDPHNHTDLDSAVRAELGIAEEDLPMAVTREFYAQQIEPFVKETKRLLDGAELQPAIEAELTARLAGLQNVDIAGLADAVTKRVEADIAARLTR